MVQTNTSADRVGKEDDDDVGALIYRETQIRKAENKTSSVANHHRRSIRKRTQVRNRDNSSMMATMSHETSKRKRLADEDLPRRKKMHRYECSADGCTNQAKKGGVCVRHGAKLKRCSYEGCTNIAVQGGVCMRHGAKLKRCSSDGCTNRAVQGGVCRKHGAKEKI